jgi:protein-S-isoprenylcysteine O-methyltransferase Ste14
MTRRRTHRQPRRRRPRLAAARADRSAAAPASQFNRVLGAHWVDKPIAIVALLPFVYEIWENVDAAAVDVPRLVLTLQLAVIVLTMALRRPPVRVTANPLFWLLAFVATYWTFLTDGLYEFGRPLVPEWLSTGVSLSAFAIGFWARLSLGRNIGFVPAERSIVTTGAYAYVRHPIYSGIFVAVLALQLRDFSWRNLVLDGLLCLLWVIKTFIEEGFLRENPAYACYMQTVRWRWFPGIT